MIVFDIESTGLNLKTLSIVSIGAVVYENPAIQFYKECKIWEGAEVMQEALAVNGYTMEEVTDARKMTEASLVKEFTEWLIENNDYALAGLNPQNDLNFLSSALERVKIDFRLKHRVLDLHSVAFVHMKVRGLGPADHTKLSGDDIMEYVGIPTEPKPHIALNGAIWEAEALSRIIDNKGLFDQFDTFKIPWK